MVLLRRKLKNLCKFICITIMLVECYYMISLNTIVPNAMENCKLGDAGFDEYDLFNLLSLKEEIFGAEGRGSPESARRAARPRR